MKKRKTKRYRTEKDVIGKIRVPLNVHHGGFTVRAMGNFNVSGIGIHPELNRAIVQIKKAAAQTNMDLGFLKRRIGNAIVKACNEILKGKYDGEFVLDVFQAGGGTPWHMNVNEVIANVALRNMGKSKGDYKEISPHDHVNMSQSSNDVMPSATRIAALVLLEKLENEIKRMIDSLRKKEKEFNKLMKVGRTHYRDAVPITLGKEIGAWRNDMEKRLRVIEDSKKNLRKLSLGGSAVGTGINVPKGFDRKIIGKLRKNTGFNLGAGDKVEETAFMTDFLDLSSGLRSLSVDLNKICNDIMILSSGPRAGIGEIILPKVEPGSSIMPGKFNPSMAEMMKMVCFQVIGNDKTIEEAVEAGNLELNVNIPVISHNLLQDLDILRNGIRGFNERCVMGIKADKAKLKEYLGKSAVMGVVLNKVMGYDKASEVVREALETNKSVEEIVLERKMLTKKQMDKLFDLK